MAELGAGEGGCGHEGQRDDSVFKVATEVFRKLKVLRAQGTTRGGGEGRASSGSRWRLAQRPISTPSCAVSRCRGRLGGRPYLPLGRPRVLVLPVPTASAW